MGIPERKERERQARTASIQGAARRLFIDKGFDATTSEDIAEAAEVSIGTIYNYFKSKDELYFSILEPVLQEFSEGINAVTHKSRKRPDNVLKELFDLVVMVGIEHPEVLRPLVYYRADKIEEIFSQEKSERLRELMRNHVRDVADVVARGIDQGVFAPVDPRAVADIIWSILLGAFQMDENRIFKGGTSRIGETLGTAWTLLLRGLRK